jgi:hypothetical protein
MGIRSSDRVSIYRTPMYLCDATHPWIFDSWFVTCRTLDPVREWWRIGFRIFGVEFEYSTQGRY